MALPDILGGIVKNVENFAGGAVHNVENAFNPTNIQNGINNMQTEGQAIAQKGNGLPLTPQQNTALSNANNNAVQTVMGSVNPAGAETAAAKPIANVVDKVVAPDAAKSLFGSEHTAAIQDALQRNGVQDYSQIAGAAHKIYNDTINPILTTTPKLVKVGDLTNSIVNEMRKMKPGLEINEAKTAAGGVINDLYNLARGGDPEALVPTHIDTPSIFSMKQDLNNTQAVKNYFNGTAPADLNDLATIASRNALSKAIQTAHPIIAEATKDYGLLQDGLPSLYKATNDAATQIAKEAANKIPPNPMSYILGNKANDYPILKGVNVLGNKMLTNPTGQKVAGAAGLLGLGVGGTLAAQSGMLKPLIDDLNGNQTSNAQDNGGSLQDDKSTVNGIHTDGIISQPYSDVKPDKNGNYSLSQAPTTDANYITDAERRAQEANLTPGTPEYNRIETNYANSQALAKNALNGEKMTFMQNAQHYLDAGTVVKGDLQQIPPGAWNSIKGAKSLEAYASNPKNPYATEFADVDAFNNQFAAAYKQVNGVGPGENQVISPGDSAQEAQQKWNRMQQFIVGAHRDNLNPYLVLTSSTGTQTAQGKPTAATYAPAPQNGDFSQMTQPTSLPPLNLPPMQGLPPLPGQ